MKLDTLQLAVLAVIVVRCSAQTATGSIQGTVMDAASNKAIAGAYVTATRTGLPPAGQTAKSAADGTFQLTALAAGAYSLCVQVPGGGYLNPCDWGLSPVAVTVAAGKSSSGNSLRIQSGAVVSVSVQDPGKLLSQKTRNGYPPDLALGVVDAKGLFYPSLAATATASATTFQVTVPHDTPLTLTVSSRALKLGDANGNALASNGSNQAFQHSSANPAPPRFSFTILGLNP